MFENDIIYGCVVSVPRPISKKSDFIIKWDMLRLKYVFTISQYPICTSDDNTYALKLHLHMDINRSHTGNDTFTEPRSQIVKIN